MLSQSIALTATLATVALALMALTSRPNSGQATQLAHAITSPNAAGTSAVEGVWVGRWKADGEPGEGKSLMCETVKLSEDTWKATFNAVCDKDYAFTMEVPGRRDGEDVVFEATVNLGEAFGGEYHWTGQVVGNKFNGVYSHAKYNGTFHMEKSRDGVIEPGIYCESPQ